MMLLSQDFYQAILGRVYRLPGGTLLSVGTAPDQLTSLLPVASGAIYLRYGMWLTTRSDDLMIPQQFVAETGERLWARDAWLYIRQYARQHPLAKVVGMDAFGQQRQYSLQEIDVDAPVCVLVYSGPEARVPAARIDGLLIGERAPEIPRHLREYLQTVDALGSFTSL